MAAEVEPRLGLVRSLLLEVTSGAPEAVEGAGPTIRDLLGSLGRYLAGQMAAGRIRPMHPLLATQAFIGPVFFHLFTRPVAARLVGLDLPRDAAIASLTEVALHGLSSPTAKEEPA